MKLKLLLRKYLENRRSLGVKLESTGSQLNAFCNFFGNIEAEKVDSEDVLAFLNGKGPLTTNWYRKLDSLRGFYKYAISRGYVTSSPLPSTTPNIQKTFTSYTFSSEDYRLLLKAVNDFDGPKNILAHRVFEWVLFKVFGAVAACT
jgi:integrase/recombinase XerD